MLFDGVVKSPSQLTSGDLEILLERLIDWLQDHDLAHFFVEDVDPEEYPDYSQVRIETILAISSLEAERVSPCVLLRHIFSDLASVKPAFDQPSYGIEFRLDGLRVLSNLK